MSNAERQRHHRRRQRAHLRDLEKALDRRSNLLLRFETLLERVLAKAELKPPLRRSIERALERSRDPRLASTAEQP